MCGIFSILNNCYDSTFVEKAFAKSSNRGPENSTIIFNNEYNIVLGFHRLAINGFNNPKSEQPIPLYNCQLICNGEIYNWKELHKLCDSPNITGSDCEIIIHLYKKYGIEYTLQLIDGVFAFILFDNTKKELYVVRDTFGIRPLFIGFNNTFSIILSSEIKSIVPFDKYSNFTINQFNPGTYSKFVYDDKKWNIGIHNCIFSKPNSFVNNTIKSVGQSAIIVRNSLVEAVKKRIVNTDRPIACLLSGGLDSSLITALVKKFSPESDLHTWSIGFEGSDDLKYAQLVADHIGSTHHSIICKEEDFLKAIPEVIYHIESYDTTTVRASVGNWLISKYIKENSDAKVIFNGDGSDELTGGYMYFHYASNDLEFDKECRRLLGDIHYFDVLRSDRTIASNGLEARTPFLDRNFVQTYLSLPYEFRFHSREKKCEKYLLRSAFINEQNRECTKSLLPREVLWRTKEAFSDGVSSQKKSWFQVIQEHLEKTYTPKEKSYEKYKNPPITLEQKYYRDMYELYFNGKNVIPYFWMPKFIEATDASARTLSVYNEKINSKK